MFQRFYTDFLFYQFFTNTETIPSKKLFYKDFNHASQNEKKQGHIEIHSNTTSDEKYVFIEIIDNGYGIKPENIDRIFTAFFTTKGLEHSGLGLPISKKIIEEHGGGIAVESSIEKGTRFILKIPVNNFPGSQKK